MRNTVLIAVATAVTAVVVTLLATVPILADKQTSLGRCDAPASAAVLELMSKAKDLPIQQFDDLI
jgi:hypothetical protein